MKSTVLRCLKLKNECTDRPYIIEKHKTEKQQGATLKTDRYLKFQS